MLFVALAFTLMIIASYWFVSDIERKHLRKDVRNAIFNTEAKINADMLEPETTLANIAETVRSMIIRGFNAETLQAYMISLNDYTRSNVDKRLLGVIGFYGVFDAFGGKFITGDTAWIMPENYIPAERPWYKAALEADGDIGVTQPYFSLISRETTVTFSRRIFDEDGIRPLGIVCLDMKLDRIKQLAVDTQFAEKGYGFLLSNDMRLLAHPEPSLLGVAFRDVNSRISSYEDELVRNGHVYEVISTDYRGIKSIVFLERLQNGWYMGIVTPKNIYFKSTRDMAMFLTALGTALAVILMIILGRISAEKDKADERMRIMFDSMPFGANIHNKSFGFFDCNQGAINLFGLSSKQEYLKKFQTLSPEFQPDGELSSKKAAEFMNKAFAEGYLRFEWMHRKSNGEPLPCEITLVRVKHNNESVLAAYMRDLTDIKTAIAEMREADERARVMLDATPICANLWSKDLHIVDCNQESVRLFDLSDKQEYIDKFYELSTEYQPDGRLSSDKAMEYVKKAFEEGYCRFEWMHRKLNGDPIPCEITLVRVKYKDGFIVMGYTRDLREQKEMLANTKIMIKKQADAEAQMYQSKQSLNILTNILNGIDAQIYAVVPHTGEILFINDFMKKQFGIEGDCTGKLCYKLFLRDQDELCDFCPCYELDKDPQATVVWEKRNPFTNRIYRNTDRYIEWTDGKTAQIQHTVDITEIMEAKENAEKSSRFKSQFLSHMSHEIRTPMNAILGITEIQLQNETLSHEMQEALNRIYNSGYLLLGIINDILDLSKIEAGKLELTPVNYDVPSLINDVVHLNIIRFDNKPIVFDLQVDENIPLTLFGDELRIKQILNNLLSNAFKYTESGKVSLSINVEQGDEPEAVTLAFCVSDTGQGMTGEQLTQLFDAYTRFNLEANRTTEGAGLGMNITKRLTDLMNGEISVESEPGKGSKFTVRLPQKIVDAGILGKTIVENLMQFRLGKMSQMKKAPQVMREYMPYGKVLIVDDVETNLYVAKGLMSPYGLSIDTAGSGFEAIEKIKNGAVYDIIFMDHFMPKMDGIEAEKNLRDLGYKKPIVALTANALAGQTEVFLASGFDGFISKPIDIHQLNAVLNKLIRDKYPAETIEAAWRKKNEMEKSSVPQSSFNKELARIFTRDAEKTFAILGAIDKRNEYGDDDIHSYMINVHAMKSALANIGETELSAFAAKLEEAARQQDIPLVSKETSAFLSALRMVIEKNRLIKDGADNENTDIISDDDMAYLREKLTVIKDACAEYDKKTAKDALSNLRQKTWPRSVTEMLEKMAEHLLHSEFTEAAKEAEDYINRESAT